MAKSVAPKRAALAEAQEELKATQEILDEAKSKLAEVEQGIAMLQEKYTLCKLIRREFCYIHALKVTTIAFICPSVSLTRS